jgi:hypothetical protein
MSEIGTMAVTIVAVRVAWGIMGLLADLFPLKPQPPRENPEVVCLRSLAARYREAHPPRPLRERVQEKLAEIDRRYYGWKD